MKREEFCKIGFDAFSFCFIPLGILAALLIGLWTLKTNLFEALSSKIDNPSVTGWSWVIVIVIACFVPFAFYKIRQNHLERKEKTEKEREMEVKNEEIAKEKEKSKAEKAKKVQDTVKFENETTAFITDGKQNGFPMSQAQLDEIKSINADMKNSFKSESSALRASMDSNTKAMDSQTKAMDSHTEAINNNTKALEKMTEEQKWTIYFL